MTLCELVITLSKVVRRGGLLVFEFYLGNVLVGVH